MRLIDADKFLIDNAEFAYRDTTHPKYDDTVKDLIDAAPTVAKWHYPSKGELPKNRDWYFGIFEESDTGWINPLPYVCDYIGKETKATNKEGWIIRNCTDIDNPIEYYKNLKCYAWAELLEPPEEIKL